MRMLSCVSLWRHSTSTAHMPPPSMMSNATHVGWLNEGKCYPSCRIKFYRRASQLKPHLNPRVVNASARCSSLFLSVHVLVVVQHTQTPFRYPSSSLYSLWAFYFCLLACGFKIFPSSSLPRLMLFLLLLFITEKWFVRYARFVSVFEAEHYFFSVAS